MQELLSKENIDYMERAHEVAEKYVRPRAAELDQTREYGWDILEALKSYELTGVWIPKEYGGHDAGVLNLCLIVEQLSRACGGVGVAFAVNALGSFPIIIGGTEAQKEKYLPPIAKGESLIAFGLSEKASGSDAGSLRTTAIADGDDFVLNGHKKWNTNGGVASFFTIYALTNPDKGIRGISPFIVEKDTPGFTVGKREDTLGIRTVSVNELEFDNCRARPRPGRLRMGPPLHLGEAPVRSDRDVPPGGPVHARGHGDPDRGRTTAGLRIGPVDRFRSEEHQQDGCHGQGLCHRHRNEGDHRRRPTLWRLRLLQRLSDREVHERRQDHPDL
jgi:hypothetical protein